MCPREEGKRVRLFGVGREVGRRLARWARVVRLARLTRLVRVVRLARLTRLVRLVRLARLTRLVRLVRRAIPRGRSRPDCPVV
jgi:hypothetical protein